MVGNCKSKLQRQPGRGRSRFFLVAVWVAAFCWAALGARGALQFDAFLGYDGMVPEASWFPVRTWWKRVIGSWLNQCFLSSSA